MEIGAYAMRHGSTENNSTGKYRGHLPLSLTPAGIQEAVEGGRFLSRLPVKPSWIISSDLPSAKQTAAICGRILGLKLMRPLRDLRGMDIGKFAGKSKEDVQAALEECFQHPEEKCGGGDKPREFDDRCARVFQALFDAASKSGKIPLIVCHGSNCVFLAKRAGELPEGSNYQEPPVDPGGLLKINETEAVPIFKVAEDSRPIPIYPADHQAGMRVPKGGSSCASCEYLGPDYTSCTSRYFIAWNGSNILPTPADEFCSDWWEPKDNLAGGVSRRAS